MKEHSPCKGYHAPVRLPYTYRRKTTFFRKLYSESRFMIHFVGKLRRLYLVNIRKKYVQNQIAQRKGACRQCGTCCNLLVTCPMLLRRGHCLVYGLCRPQSCKVFPIDQRDIKEVQFYNRTCGFRFNAKTSKASGAHLKIAHLPEKTTIPPHPETPQETSGGRHQTGLPPI